MICSSLITYHLSLITQKNMMSQTHAAFAVLACSLALSTSEPFPLVVAAMASQLPDVDTTKSFIGRVFFPLAIMLEEFFPHRTITHSFFATAIFAVMLLPAYFLFDQNGEIYFAALIGYFVGWFADVFTKTGVTAFYPATSARLVVPANPRLRLSTGSRAEWFLFLLVLIACSVSINIHSEGGILRKFNALLAQQSGAADLFKREGRTRQIIAHIEGAKRQSGADVNANFEIVELLQSNNLLVSDEHGVLFEVGENGDIIASRIVGSLGRQIKTDIKEINLNDESLRKTFASISAPPNSRVFVSGDLQLKDADLLQIPVSFQKFNTIQISGDSSKTAQLHGASLEDCRKLAEFYASGNLLIKVVSYE